MQVHVRPTTTIVLVCLAIAITQTTTAQEDIRTWTDTSGKFRVQASLVEFDEKNVTLKRADGRIIEVPIERLSNADRLLLQSKKNKSPEPENWIALIDESGPIGMAKKYQELSICGDVRLGSAPNSLIAAPGKGVVAALSRLKNVNLRSKDSFGDCEVQLEFLVGKNSNSGIKLQGRYEIQIFDSHSKANPTAKDCGGIYPHWKPRGPGKGLQYIDKGYPPKSNAAKPAGEWQTLKVVFTSPRFDANKKKIANARFVSVVLNGATIHSNIEVDSPTGNAATPLPEVSHAPLMLQMDHGAVAFRRVRVRPIEKFEPNRKTQPAPENPNTASPTSPSKNSALPRPSVNIPETMRLVRLGSLNHATVDDCDPWISFDGNTLYWSRYNYGSYKGTEQQQQDRKQFGLFCASRNGPNEKFDNPRLLSSTRIRHPSVSPDGLTLVGVAHSSKAKSQPFERVHIASRESADEPFKNFSELDAVQRLCPHPYYKFPHFNKESTRLIFALRTARDLHSLKWADPTMPFLSPKHEPLIGLDKSITGNYPWPMIVENGRYLICCHEDRIWSNSPGGG